jgi:hypothetical protein
MITRSQLLGLAALDDNRLKSLVRRDQVPFAEGGDFGAPADVPARNRYRDADALLLILQDDLSRYGGLDLSTASSIVVSNIGAIQDRWGMVMADAAAIWIGAAFLDDGPGATPGRSHVAGTLQEIEQWLAIDVFGEGPRRTQAFRLALVNVNRALATLLQRAGAAGIEIDILTFWERSDEARRNER